MGRRSDFTIVQLGFASFQDGTEQPALFQPHESDRGLTGVGALASIFEAILEAFSFAVVIVDARGRLHFANRSARELFEAGVMLACPHGQLQATHPAAAEALARATDEAAQGRWPSPSNAVPLRGPEGQLAVAHIMPLRDAANEGFAAIFVTSPHGVPPQFLEVLATLYDLTPSEARVLGEIASGKNRAAAAAALGVADSTVKTHLARVFAKTRTSEQAELTILAMSLTPPVAAPTKGKRSPAS
jgi:DNA-binding CsgD family transcriptional regulator